MGQSSAGHECYRSIGKVKPEPREILVQIGDDRFIKVFNRLFDDGDKGFEAYISTAQY